MCNPNSEQVQVSAEIWALFVKDCYENLGIKYFFYILAHVNMLFTVFFEIFNN